MTYVLIGGACLGFGLLRLSCGFGKVQPFTLDQWKGLLCENTDIVESEYRA